MTTYMAMNNTMYNVNPNWQRLDGEIEGIDTQKKDFYLTSSKVNALEITWKQIGVIVKLWI